VLCVQQIQVEEAIDKFQVTNLYRDFIDKNNRIRIEDNNKRRRWETGNNLKGE
jgi:hypothetical protein